MGRFNTKRLEASLKVDKTTRWTYSSIERLWNQSVEVQAQQHQVVIEDNQERIQVVGLVFQIRWTSSSLCKTNSPSLGVDIEPVWARELVSGLSIGLQSVGAKLHPLSSLKNNKSIKSACVTYQTRKVYKSQWISTRPMWTILGKWCNRWRCRRLRHWLRYRSKKPWLASHPVIRTPMTKTTRMSPHLTTNMMRRKIRLPSRCKSSGLAMHLKVALKKDLRPLRLVLMKKMVKRSMEGANQLNHHLQARQHNRLMTRRSLEVASKNYSVDLKNCFE